MPPVKLLKEIDKTMSIIEIGADVINLSIERTCKVCGIGKYQLIVNDNPVDARNFGFNVVADRKMKIFTCSHCGNVQLFSYLNRPPDAWRK